MNYEEKAVTFFGNNFNCSQAVFATFAEELGMDVETALKIGTPFGSGARRGEICGAVSGALMVLGLKYGHCHSENKEEKARAYQVADDFLNRFTEAKGTVVCRELLNYDLTREEDMKEIMSQNLFRTVCPEMVRCAAAIVEEMLAEYGE